MRARTKSRDVVATLIYSEQFERPANEDGEDPMLSSSFLPAATGLFSVYVRRTPPFPPTFSCRKRYTLRGPQAKALRALEEQRYPRAEER
jgi:hypothetical protein